LLNVPYIVFGAGVQKGLEKRLHALVKHLRKLRTHYFIYVCSYRHSSRTYVCSIEWIKTFEGAH